MKQIFSGIPASAGIGIGKVYLCQDETPKDLAVSAGTAAAEWKRYRRASRTFQKRIRAKADGLESQPDGTQRAEILRSEAEMARDPSLLGSVREEIRSGKPAETALKEASEPYIQALSSAGNERTRLREADVRDMRDGVLRILLDLPDPDLSALEPGTILAANQLSPSLAVQLDPGKVSGVILQDGGVLSHTAILLRSMEIPVVIGEEEFFCTAKNGDIVALDGAKGWICLHPDREDLLQCERESRSFSRLREEQRKYMGKDTVTKDGDRIWLGVNASGENDVLRAEALGYDGVGLLRSELLFQDWRFPPTEEEQVETYRRMALALGERPLVIRVLDVGADKNPAWLLPREERNPALGCRGIRFCLREDKLFLTQLRAILRASAFGNVKILLPMITDVNEVRKVRELLAAAQAQLTGEGKAFCKKIPVGVMIETPASVWCADLLAEESDFFSVGTNDLTQYVMAADRENAGTAPLSSLRAPSVLRALSHVANVAKTYRIPLETCGEAATDTLFLPVLLGLGFTQLSVPPAALLAVRRTLSLWTKEEASHITSQVLSMETESKVRKFLKDNSRK